AREDADKAEAKAREDADNKLSDRINDEAKAREDADKAEAKAREDADKAEAKAREDADKAEATTRANEDKRIEAKFDGEVSRLDGRIDKLNDNVEKVGAMAAAIANLHTMGYDPEAPTEIAVGVGQYRDKTGLALGAFHYPNRDFMLSFSVSTAGDEFMGGIGATWRFGRKSPEELRQAEAEKAAKAKLAKAEAAKKAAKDARVAAQQKRHAEMLAARTGK
ncbi:YadA-like family protein, partial [Phascolarctobacterium succinatutens]|uniref:YadA-like family protein n=1 Tax=Phascolarctobacterium succinatutens TaxID=626940 RepID=UPI003FD83240